MASWEPITITLALYGMRNHQITCSYPNCNRSFKVGDKIIRHGNGNGNNRYFCPSCAEKLRI